LKIFLRFISFNVAGYVVLTLAYLVRFASLGTFNDLSHLGLPGIEGLIGAVIILIAGPIASFDLWRFRQRGLFLTAGLCALAVIFFAPGVYLELFVRRTPVIWYVLGPFFGFCLILILLLSRPARRACS
jgi:hypothetical protein